MGASESEVETTEGTSNDAVVAVGRRTRPRGKSESGKGSQLSTSGNDEKTTESARDYGRSVEALVSCEPLG